MKTRSPACFRVFFKTEFMGEKNIILWQVISSCIVDFVIFEADISQNNCNNVCWCYSRCYVCVIIEQNMSDYDNTRTHEEKDTPKNDKHAWNVFSKRDYFYMTECFFKFKKVVLSPGNLW